MSALTLERSAKGTLPKLHASPAIAKSHQPGKRTGKPSRAVIARRSDLYGSDIGLDLTTLGGRLAYARLRAELTQEALAEAVDKVRGTINAYESDKIAPPIDIVTRLAKVLKVSPSFLAFGEHSVKMTEHGNAAEDVVNIDEITFGRDGSYVSGAFAMPKAMAESYVPEVSSLKVYVMDHNAPVFNLRSGDRVFADTSVTEITNRYDMYLIEVPGGMEIVRSTPTLAKTAKISLEGGRGDRFDVRSATVNVIGAVVGQISRT